MQSFVATAALFCAITTFAGEPRLHIVTSFLPLYCWTVNVAGEHALVENLLPPRSEPHEYSFTPGDARKLARADRIIVNGLGLEMWLSAFLRGNPEAKAKVVSVSEGLNSELLPGVHGHGYEHDGHETDQRANPHIWLDPRLAAHGVSNILLALQTSDPRHAASYASNAQAYLTTLRALDRDIEQSLSTVSGRAIVTYHDAFPYFARRYRLEVAGVVEEVPDVNPTPKYLARLSRTMREGGIPVIFTSLSSPNRLARRIASDLHVQLDALDTLESGPLSPSAYEERMRRNAAVLQTHLKK